MDKPEIPKAQQRVLPTAETGTVNLLSDLIDCPLCAGQGKLRRVEFFEKTGMREPSLIAELSAKQAVESMHAKLWGDFREQLGEQVSAKTRELEKQLLQLEGKKAALERDIELLREGNRIAVEQAKKTQELADQGVLAKEKQALQDELSAMKGELAETNAALTAAQKQQELNTRDAMGKVRDEEKALREKLQVRIDEMHQALVDEQKSKVELENKLKRLEIEVDGKVAEARRLAVQEKEAEISAKAEEAQAIKVEIAALRKEVDLIPTKEALAKRDAIQEQEDKLRKVELARDNLQTERDQLQEQLTEALRKLEQSKGKVEERTFEELVSGIPGVWIEDWSSKKQSGDYHVGLFGREGEKLLQSRIIVDNKNVGRLTDPEIEKLIRDAQHHSVALAAIVVSDESALRPKDKDARFALVGGVTVLRTTRDWFPRDLDLLRPLMKRQAEEGPDFLKRNLAVATEVRSHMKTLDQMEKFMRLARENASKAEEELKKYRTTLDVLCTHAGSSAKSEPGEEE